MNDGGAKHKGVHGVRSGMRVGEGHVDGEGEEEGDGEREGEGEGGKRGKGGGGGCDLFAAFLLVIAALNILQLAGEALDLELVLVDLQN